MEQTQLINSNLKGSQLFTYTNTLFNIIDGEIWGHVKEAEEPYRYCYTVVYKMFGLLDAGSYLVNNMDNKPHYIQTLYLTCRAILLDSIYLMSVLDKYERKEDYKTHIDHIMSDHIHAFYSSAHTETDRKSIREKHPEYFIDDKLKYSKRLSVVAIINSIKIKELKEQSLRGKFFYDIFSKYEHQGHYTYLLLHNHHLEKDKEKMKICIIDSISIAMYSIIIAIKIWINQEDDKFKQLYKWNEAFCNKHW